MLPLGEFPLEAFPASAGGLVLAELGEFAQLTGRAVVDDEEEAHGASVPRVLASTSFLIVSARSAWPTASCASRSSCCVLISTSSWTAFAVSAAARAVWSSAEGCIGSTWRGGSTRMELIPARRAPLVSLCRRVAARRALLASLARANAASAAPCVPSRSSTGCIATARFAATCCPKRCPICCVTCCPNRRAICCPIWGRGDGDAHAEQPGENDGDEHDALQRGAPGRRPGRATGERPGR